MGSGTMADLLSAGAVVLAAVLGGFIGAVLTDHYSARASRRERRRALYREALYVAGQIRQFADLIVITPWWRRWLPWPDYWQRQVFSLISGYTELGSRVVAELVLEDDPAYKQVTDLLVQLAEIQGGVATHVLARKPDPVTVEQIDTIIGQLREVTKSDLAGLDSPWLRVTGSRLPRQGAVNGLGQRSGDGESNG